MYCLENYCHILIENCQKIHLTNVNEDYLMLWMFTLLLKILLGHEWCELCKNGTSALRDWMCAVRRHSCYWSRRVLLKTKELCVRHLSAKHLSMEVRIYDFVKVFQTKHYRNIFYDYERYIKIFNYTNIWRKKLLRIWTHLYKLKELWFGKSIRWKRPLYPNLQRERWLADLFPTYVLGLMLDIYPFNLRLK